MGQKQKTEERERKKERLNDGNNNGQATHGARKHGWRTQAALAKNKQMDKLTNIALFTIVFLYYIIDQWTYKV